MKTYMNKILACLLAVSLILSLLSACGEQAAKNNPKKPGTSNVDSAPGTSDDNQPGDASNTDNSNNSTVQQTPGAPSVSVNTVTKVKKDYVFTKPGTENWSTAEDAVILTVDNETTHTNDYYGWYLTEATNEQYLSMSKADKERFLHYLFDEEKVNMFAFLFNTKLYYPNDKAGFDISYFKQQWHIGKGSLLEEAMKRGITLFMCPTIGVPAYMRGVNVYSPYTGQTLRRGLDPKYAPDLGKVYANMVYDLYKDCGLKISFVGTSDEPDFGTMTVEALAEVIKSMRKALDSMGLKSTKIASVETTNFAPRWYKYLRNDKECWNALGAFTGHDFTVGNISQEFADMVHADGKYIMSTSSGILDEVTVMGDYLEYDENDKPIINDYFTAVRNLSSYLNDTNLCVSAYTAWLPMIGADTLANLDSIAPNFYHLFYNKTGELLGDTIATSANFNYYAQALKTVSPGAAIFPCSNNVDGRMAGSFEKSQLCANAGMNKDGSWGINILNKTDSDIAYSFNFKTQPGKKITVNLDILGLYGTGTQIFDVYSCATDGTAQKRVGTVTLVDGRGYTEVYPFELVSLRSRQKIGINYQASQTENVTKGANILYYGHNTALLNGVKTRLAATPALTVDDTFTGTLLTVKDLATVLGATYERDGKNVYIHLGDAMLSFIIGSSDVKYVGEISGSARMDIKAYEKNGEVYILLSKSLASAINSAFPVHFTQYAGAGLIVVYTSGEAPENPVINLKRFTKLFS